MNRGSAPTLAALRARGGYHAVTSSFPSVTGPAYVPFLMGRHPARAGLPGLRWYDRSRSLPWAFIPTRSYSGIDVWHVDHDIDQDIPTLLELAQPSLSAMSILARGASHGRIGRSIPWMLRAASAHFRGDLERWRHLELLAMSRFMDTFRKIRPRASVLAITSPDKFAHQQGPFSESVRHSVGTIEQAATEALDIALKDGWRHTLHVWVVGDHGHAPVQYHDDLHGWLLDQHLRVMAHPGIIKRHADIALMVGGNAMAHLYIDPFHRSRRWWSEHAEQWDPLLERLCDRKSVDLVAVAESATVTRVQHSVRGAARIVHTPSARFGNERWSYVPLGSGDPLALGGAHRQLGPADAWQVTSETGYPDSVVQLSLLAQSQRSGDIVVSASNGWDLRSRYEPIPHVSTHGALLRDQMLVPLLIDIPTVRTPQRTADLVPSALDLLGITIDLRFEGRSFANGRPAGPPCR